MKNALFAGLLNAQANDNNVFELGSHPVPSSNITSFAVSPLCATGNCTFPQYSSLALRHQCFDITEALVLQPGSNMANQTVRLPIVGYDDPQHLTATYYGDLPQAPGSGVIYTTESNVTSGILYNQPNLPNGTVFADRLLLADVFMVMLDPASAGVKTTKHFNAFRCNLYIGMEVYNASVSNGLFAETNISFVAGDWTFIRAGEDADDERWYWLLEASVAGTRHQVRIGYVARQAMLVYFPSVFKGDNTIQIRRQTTTRPFKPFSSA